jgi:hypothetical protein
MQCGGDFSDGSSESVHCDDDELVAFAKPAHAFRPPGSITPGASRGGVSEHPVGCDACSGDDIVLLVDGLLPSGDPKVGGNAHAVTTGKVR